jgi:hypothetical protein
MPQRRFPPPRTVIELAEAFCVVDAAGYRKSCVYFDLIEPGVNSDRMTKDEARASPTAWRGFPS